MSPSVAYRFILSVLILLAAWGLTLMMPLGVWAQ